MRLRLAAEEVLPAASVCDAVTVFDPSGPAMVTLWLKALELHVVDVGLTPDRSTAKPDSQVPARVKKVPCTELVFAGLVKATTGAVLSTVSAVPLGPTAALVFSAVSEVTPAATLMVTVPLPVQPESVTVRVERPVPETALLQLAVPVAFKMISEPDKVTAPMPTASEKVSTQDAVPVLLTIPGLTLAMETAGGVLSRTTVRDKAKLVLPAKST